MESTLTVEEIERIEEVTLERLPRVLKQDARVVPFIDGSVGEKVPRRDEFARLLDEVQQHPKKTAAQFGQVDKHACHSRSC